MIFNSRVKDMTHALPPGLWCIYHVYSRLAFNYFASLMWFMMYLLDCLYTFDCLKINISTHSLPPNSWRYTLYRFFLSLTQKCVTNSKLVHLFEFNIEIGLKTCHIFSANKGIVSLYDVFEFLWLSCGVVCIFALLFTRLFTWYENTNGSVKWIDR